MNELILVKFDALKMMGCMLRSLAITLVLTITFASSLVAQITGYELEPAVVHTGAYADGVDLNGYITYDLYVTVTNPDDVVSAVYAIDGGQDILFEFECNLFQHELAGATVEANNCAFWGILPSMEYDSFMTINKHSTCDVGDFFLATTIPVAATVAATFEGPVNGDYFDGGPLSIQDGTWFTVNNGINGVAGADLKVLIARFTTCGGISGCFGVQAFINGVGGNVSDVEICLDELNPCDEFPLDDSIEVTTDILCNGEVATIEGGGGGNGVVTYNLYETGVDSVLISTQEDNPVFTDLAAGCYLIELIDGLGCTDTTEIVCVEEPPLLELDATLDQDILCALDNNGIICFSTTGGTGNITCQLDGLVVLDGCLENLACGDHFIDCVDENNCAVDTMISITCPEPLIHDSEAIGVLCYGDCNGSINSSIEGGTDSLTVSYTLDGMPFGNSFTMGNALPVDASMSDLCPGDYQIIVTDVNACELTIDLTVEEPDTLELNLIIGDLSCNSECTGSIELEITGGTGPFNSSCTDSLGVVLDPPSDLCAGSYSCFVIDANGCEASADAEILEPDGITYDIITDSTTCFGFCDGAIFIENIQGGSGNFSFDIPEGEFVDNGVDSLGYINLCAGLFNLVITDIDGNCTLVEPDIEVGQPEELLLQAIVGNIDCYGFANGSIEINCAGGTGDVMVISPDTVPCPALLTDFDAGNYDVIIEDEYGCQTMETVEVSQPDTLTIETVDLVNILCGGDCTGEFDYLVEGGVEPYNVFLNDSLVIEEIEGLCAADDYDLCVIDANNCESCIVVEIEEPDPVQSFVQETPVTCTGMTDGSALVLFTGGTGPLEVVYELEDIDLNSLAEGIYPFSVTDSVGCSIQDTIFVGAATVTDMMVEMFTSPESCWEENDGTATAAVTGGFGEITYLWDDKDEQTTFTAVGLESEEQYSVIITDSLGCTITAFAFIEPTEGCLFISNALTPNGDGSNDVWLIGGLEYFPESTVQVYNRWGQLMFESRGYATAWDGTHNGNKVAVADYYYIIDYKASEVPIMGTVTVKY